MTEHPRDSRVLVVDDQEAKRYLKGQLLRRAGFECEEAGTGAEALARVRAGSFAVVVLDVNLPDISGLEVCRILKQELPSPAIQVLQISETAVDDADRVRGLNAGADVYLTEPVSGEVLVATLRALIRVRKVELALAAARDLETAARQEAERANRLKDDFLATLSHELRTPLNVMSGSVWQLRQTPLSESQQRAVDALDRSTRAQTKLINDLLDISRITSGKLEVSTAAMDWRAVVESALEHLRRAAAAKGITVEAALTSVPVLGDAARLEQVVTNIFNNAVQFTPDGGRIAVSLSAEGAFAVLRVRDSGEGIDPDLLPQLFNRFQQGDQSPGRTHMGLGLGLAIVRDLVRLHHGTVELDSAGKGHGTVVTIRLPRSDAPHDIEPAPAEMADLTGLEVLVVEDDPDSATILREMLTGAGASASVATSAGEALSILETRRFDVLVSDIAMPQSTGYDLIRVARARGHRLPALAVTAFSMAEDRARAVAHGFDAHLPKPLDLAALTGAIAMLAHASRRR